MKTTDSEIKRTDLSDEEINDLFLRLKNDDPTLNMDDALEITKAQIRQTFQLQDEYEAYMSGNNETKA